MRRGLAGLRVPVYYGKEVLAIRAILSFKDYKLLQSTLHGLRGPPVDAPPRVSAVCGTYLPVVSLSVMTDV